MTEQSTGGQTIDPTIDVEPGGRRRIRRALLSVSDKTGLLELATELLRHGVALVSTGKSAAMLTEAGLAVQKVEDVTGFPEFLDGRVKTLHPNIHGGLLADTRKQSHRDQLDELGIGMFDLVVVNLYPFRSTVASGASVDDCIEQIDIGGPAMIRASAKNHPSVATVVEPGDYGQVIAAANAGGFTLAERQFLAAKAFAHTASYDVAVASWMNSAVAPDPDGWPRWTGATWERQSVLRYGENPHQRAALYRHWREGLAGAKQLHGKEMSYNNYVDVDAAWRAANDFADPAVAIIKHANPCGIAVVTGGNDESVAVAHAKALACDPVSAFGGVIAVNRAVTVALAEQIAEVFTEVLLAPAFDEAALDILTRRKNIRLLVMPAEVNTDPIEFRGISGGVLVQTRDAIDAPGDDPASWTLAAGSAVDSDTLADLDFAWRACRSVKSNAILLAHDGASVGIGMGQVNRVDSARLAVERAGDRAAGSVAASDAYFPFADGPQVLFDAGVKAVVQPGGSMRDPEVLAAAEAAGVSIYLTGTRHFFH
ncbi:MAG: bifunctional phosphoribosylaminoimidazolecarboxamide formyltransferase/IMP cyclohydrolase [Nakamurella sp.]